MNKRLQLLTVAVAGSLLLCEPLFAIGMKGGGGGSRGGGGHSGASRGGGGHSGGSRGGGGHSRGGGASHASARPSGHSSAPNLGHSRPSGGQHASARPSGGHSSRPSYGGGAGHGISRPSGGGHSMASGMNRPSGGMKPSTRPGSMNRPSGVGGGSRPSFGNQASIGSRPGAGGAGINRPGGASTLPGNRPGNSLPNLGGSRPTTRPGMDLANRPNPGINQPGGGQNFPNRPDGGIRPGGGIANRPGGGAGNLPGITANRPDFGGGGARPSPGGVGDFLGMQRPLRPGGSGDIASVLPSRPGAGGGGIQRPDLRPDNRPDGLRPDTRPGEGGAGTQRPGLRPDNRPDGGLRPDNRPDGGLRPDTKPAFRPGDRPDSGLRPDNRPDGGLRPDNRPWWGDRPSWGNNNSNIINNRPQWANIDNSTNLNINNNWNNAFVNANNAGWWNPGNARSGYYNDWGSSVLNSYGWGSYGNYGGYFNQDWWYGHDFNTAGCWHYCDSFNNSGWDNWWTVPAWGAMTNWFNWTAPQQAWAQPVYYDYGTGGNVVYDNDYVYIGGQQISSTEDFAKSAADLATVPPPATPEEAAAAEWMPLGTFAVTTNPKDVDPTRIVQLAVSKDGIVSGTLYNTVTDETHVVQGKVDKNTQRVACRVGESETLVVETGLYNLTQKEAPLLVHFGADKVENWLLVRLEDPNAQTPEQTAAVP